MVLQNNINLNLILNTLIILLLEIRSRVSILILKDVLKNENVFQLINDNPTLKDIYNFSYLNSKEDPPLLKEITLLFQELRTSIIFSLDRLENDFKGKL